jgi:hypothetical protein
LQDQLAIINPSKLRLPTAAFNPERASSANLLHGVAPAAVTGGLGAAALSGQDQTRKRGGRVKARKARVKAILAREGVAV